MNPMQMMNMFKNGGNPQQMIQQMMEDSRIANNPIAINAIQKYQNGDMDGLQAMAENMCRGTSIDEVKNRIMKQFGMK